jgi:hypothetical protein
MALVRVRFENGLEGNLSATVADAAGLEVLDEPTTNGDGTFRLQTRRDSRRRKPKTSVSQEARKKKAGGDPSAPTAEEATE